MPNETVPVPPTLPPAEPEPTPPPLPPIDPTIDVHDILSAHMMLIDELKDEIATLRSQTRVTLEDVRRIVREEIAAYHARFVGQMLEIK
jgi:hypothetical protein